MRADHRGDTTPKIVESVLEYTGPADFFTPQPASPSIPLPRPTPRILNADESVPALHHAVVSNALAQITVAAQELEGVYGIYRVGDPRVSELHNILVRLRMVLFVGDSWLVWHPAR